MQTLSLERKRFSWVQYIVLLVSLIYLAFLVSTNRTGAFFSADGGIKYMVVKQLTEGHGFKYLYLPQPQWVQHIWQDGFFPLQPPFLYPTPHGYLFVFPPAFQILSSFFYAHFGNAGLLIIPIGCTLLLWTGMLLLLRRCGFGPSRIAAGMFILVFCSPLTVYGATYWEHMPAVLLLLSGLAFVVLPLSGMFPALIMGLLSGLAAWFRPEAMMMNILYGLAMLILYRRERQANIPGFLTGMAIGVGSFLLFNKVEFDSWFGVHSYQVLQDEVQGGVVRRVFNNLLMNNVIALHHYLFSLLLLPVVYLLLKHRRQLDIRTVLLVGIVIVYCIATPFMVPNEGGKQWGARYFLPLIPVVLVTLLLIEKEWDLIRGRQIPLWLTGVVLLFTGYSFYRNTYKGGMHIFPWENEQRVAPAMAFINRQPGNVVVVSDNYIAMEMGYMFDQKYFFLAPADSGLNRLVPMLRQQGIHRYTYVFDNRKLDTRPESLHDSTVVFLGQTGDFGFKECTIP